MPTYHAQSTIRHWLFASHLVWAIALALVDTGKGIGGCNPPLVGTGKGIGGCNPPLVGTGLCRQLEPVFHVQHHVGTINDHARVRAEVARRLPLRVYVGMGARAHALPGTALAPARFAYDVADVGYAKKSG